MILLAVVAGFLLFDVAAVPPGVDSRALADVQSRPSPWTSSEVPDAGVLLQPGSDTNLAWPERFGTAPTRDFSTGNWVLVLMPSSRLRSMMVSR